MSGKDPWASIDRFGDALHFLRMTGVFYCRSNFTAPWGLELPAFDSCIMFHLVTAGRCWLALDGMEPMRLEAGDFALIPHGRGHRLFDDAGTACGKLFDLPRDLVSDRYEILRHGGGGAPVDMICGTARFDHPAARQFIGLMPPAIRFDAARSAFGDTLPELLRLMAAEVRQRRPGGEAVITRLADIVIIQAIRAWLDRDPLAQTGWLGALRDPQVGHALMLIHRDCAHPWTLEKLASAAAMSRSAFAARFTALVGVPAMQYVTDWRMNFALQDLKDSAAPVAAVADRYGYLSEAAFSRAFKRVTGVSPGSVRRAHVSN